MTKLRKAITFLGTGNYEETIYQFEGKDSQPTKLFSTALCEFFKPDEILVFVTKGAKEKWFNELEEKLGTLFPEIKIQAIEIPDGHSTEELWTIFDALTSHIDDGDAVIFDITHSFRTIPMLGILSAFYLNKAKNVKIEGIYYGAFEAGKKQDLEIHRAPVFDLTLFFELMNWTTATDKFISTGDAKDLSEILTQTHNDTWRNDDVSPDDKSRKLKPVGEKLNKMSRSYLLTRPAEFAKCVAVYEESVKPAREELEAKAKPFALLLEQIETNYLDFKTNDLSSERKLVKRYVEQKQFVQAITLAREWLVSVACAELMTDKIAGREAAEDMLNEDSYRKKRKKGEPIILSEDVVGAWQTVVGLRNDVAHCGFRKKPDSSSNIADRIEKLVEKLDVVKIGCVQKDDN